MKLYVLALLSVLVLAACSDSGSGGGGGKKPISPDDFNPKAVPANPAPKAYIQQTMMSLEHAKKFHPEDAAIFTSIIEGTEVKNVDYYTQDEAIRKLDPVGQDLVARVKQNCFLNPARKTKTGGDSKNSTIVEKLNMSSDGTACNFKVQKSVEQTTSQGPVSGDDKTGWYQGSAIMTNITKENRELVDGSVQHFTTLVSSANDMVTNGTMNVRLNRYTNEQSLDMVVTGNGNIAINLVDGESIKGPATLWMNIKSSQEQNGRVDSTIDMRTKFEGKSPKGDIVIVMLMTDKGSQTYLNGELIEGSAISPTKPADFKNQLRQLQQVALKAL